MAGKQISDLTAAGTIDGTELLHLVQGGNSRKATVSAILTLVGELARDAVGAALTEGDNITVDLDDDSNTITISSNDATKAPLASPIFTGTPAAPTAAAATNTTQIATTAFVQTALAALVDTAPGALDTLNELAAALGDDPNFAATITAALATKAPLASPALTGAPTAPTQTTSDDSTKISTTAFVKAAIAAAGGGGGGSVAFADITGLPEDNTALDSALDAKAPLASPALTGTPTAPTASGGTSTTQIATTAFVAAAIAALADSAPATLDTLNELAAALGDDPNFATTVTNALAAKASLTGAETLENKRIKQRAVAAGATSGTLTIAGDSTDLFVATALTGGITLNITGTPTDGQRLIVRVKDNGTARSIAYNAIIRAMGVTLPTTTTANKWAYLGLAWNATDSKWDVLAVATEA